jgi:hypothetical protein
MVEKVEAWKASDGTLHESERKACEVSAKLMLGKCISNPGLVTEILNNGKCVYDALSLIYLGGLAEENSSEGQP